MESRISKFDLWMERLAALRQRRWVGLALGVSLFALALAIRFWLSEALAPFPFLTFFPAIVLTALLSGVRPAVLVTVLAALTSWYYFVPPYNSWALRPQESVGIAFFLLVAAIDILLIEMLHRAVQRLHAERTRASALLAMRESMFKELQHRVANNMQFVSGMLNMQQRALTDSPAAAAVLEQAASRLRAMARIHRRLYDPANADRPLGTLIEELCHEVLHATGANNLVVRVDIPPITLPIDRVHTLSLVVTEALTNAVKHAFPDGRPGTIRISLERLPGDEFSFVIADDGIGLPANFDAAASPSLGMKIVQGLASQLGGVFSMAPGRLGAEVRLRFSAI